MVSHKFAVLACILSFVTACGGGGGSSSSSARQSSSSSVLSSEASSSVVSEVSSISSTSSVSSVGSVSSASDSSSSSNNSSSSVASSSANSSVVSSTSSVVSSVSSVASSASSETSSSSSVIGSSSSTVSSSSSAVSSASSSVVSGNDEDAVYCLAQDQVPGVGGADELPALSDKAVHHTGTMMTEHMAMLSLMDYANATHVAVNDGRWCDPDTWHNKYVPGNDANAVIATGVSVVYDQVANTRLKTVRVDGELEFSNTQSSRLILDTLFVDPRGELIIGTKADPVRSSQKVEIIIADNGAIDTTWDTQLLSRGIVAHGTTTIHGAYKKTHLKVETDPGRGDSVLHLAESASGWKVGDTIVVTGSIYYGWKWDNNVRAVIYHDTQDEVRTITDISGRDITLNESLDYDHSSPRADLKVSVANFTRNVSIATENADSVPVHQRGHVMFMHTDDVDVRYAEFHELGRTDKSKDSFDVGDVSRVTATSNVRGRYSFHFHRSGTANEKNPALAIGNAVFGSPGWGYTHHDSHAVLHNNASFNTFGAGFVAETGNETGIWSKNIAIKGEGNSAFNPKNGNDVSGFDMGMTGDGFWFQGRLVRSIDNIAASVNHGFVYFHRGTGMLSFPSDRFMLEDALGVGSSAAPDDAPIRNFDGNEAYASTVGLYVVKANPKQGHDIYTELTDFTAWHVRAGAAIEYTSHYLVKDFDLIGAPSANFFAPTYGIEYGKNTTDMVTHNARIDSFPEGIGLVKTQTNSEDEGKDQFVVIGGEYINVDTPLAHYEPSVDVVIDTADLIPERFLVDIDNNDGRFEYLSPATNAGSGVSYVGTKTDSIGPIPIPAGADDIGTSSSHMRLNVEKNGYYQDVTSGDMYTVVEEYFSDRATGEIHKFGLKTYLGPDVVSALGNSFSAWADARFLGAIDIASQPPVANNDSGIAAYETDLSINLVDNDSDPEGDSLRIDGVVQPKNGTVFASSKKATYRPNFEFTGTDSFYYWVTDGNGNFTKARVNITVVR